MNQLTILWIYCLLKIIVGRGPPTLLSNASNFITLDVHENNSLELHCPVINTPDLSIQWSKNNEDLDPLWTSSNLVIKRFLLKIHQVHLSDAAVYKCIVVNGFGSIQVQFRINVRSNETTANDNEQRHEINWNMNSLSGEAPEFISRNDNNRTGSTKVIQPVGTTVQLKCLATGKPSPEIRWKKNGKILSEDEYGVTQEQILTIKDLRQSDAGHYTCELFNSFGAINATYILVVTSKEKLQFLGNDPQNTSVEIDKTAILKCSIQTNDSTTKIQWLKKSTEVFQPNAIVLDSEQYEYVEPSQEQQILHFSNNILSKPLILSPVTLKDDGQYICFVQNDKATNYRRASINVIDHHKGFVPSMDINYNLFYVILIPLCVLGLILFYMFCCRQNPNHQNTPHLHANNRLKSSTKPRQPLIHRNAAMIPSGTTTRTSNDYIANSLDSIPITRHYQQHQRYGPPVASDLGSYTSSNLYYARLQAL